MAYSNEAVYSQSIVTFAAKATAAKTTMTDSTNAVLAYTAPTEGAVITRLRARPLGTTASATVLYAFTSTDSGTTLAMKDVAFSSAADTVSTTDAPATIDFGVSAEDPIYLAGSERLYVAASVALAAGWQFEGHGEVLTKAAG